MQKLNKLLHIVYIVAVPFLVYNLADNLRFIVRLPPVQMAVCLGLSGILCFLFGKFKFKNELPLGLMLAGLMLMCYGFALTYHMFYQIPERVLICCMIFLIGRYVYKVISIKQSFTIKKSNQFFKEAFMVLFLIVALPKITSQIFVAITPQCDDNLGNEVMIDYIKGYAEIHKDEENPLRVANIAWRQFVNESTELRSLYFFQLTVCGVISLILFYLACTLSSPIIAAACVVSAIIMMFGLSVGAGGIVLHYGMIMDVMFILLGLFMVVRHLYQQSKNK